MCLLTDETFNMRLTTYDLVLNITTTQKVVTFYNTWCLLSKLRANQLSDQATASRLSKDSQLKRTPLPPSLPWHLVHSNKLIESSWRPVAEVTGVLPENTSLK